MSPEKFHHHQQQTMMNGPRPSPLKINKESHLIQKPSFSSSSSNSSLSVSLMASVDGAKQKQQQMQRRNEPVIIYTHSPKVIHIEPRDFMALVQKLTGPSSSAIEEIRHHGKKEGTYRGFTDKASKVKRDSNVGDKDQSSSSASTQENYGGGGGLVSTWKNNCLADIPMFTPDLADYFCSPKPLNWYRSYSDSACVSPSVLELMKGVDYY